MFATWNVVTEMRKLGFQFMFIFAFISRYRADARQAQLLSAFQHVPLPQGRKPALRKQPLTLLVPCLLSTRWCGCRAARTTCPAAVACSALQLSLTVLTSFDSPKTHAAEPGTKSPGARVSPGHTNQGCSDSQ